MLLQIVRIPKRSSSGGVSGQEKGGSKEAPSVEEVCSVCEARPSLLEVEGTGSSLKVLVCDTSCLLRQPEDMYDP